MRGAKGSGLREKWGTHGTARRAPKNVRVLSWTTLVCVSASAVRTLWLWYPSVGRRYNAVYDEWDLWIPWRVPVPRQISSDTRARRLPEDSRRDLTSFLLDDLDLIYPRDDLPGPSSPAVDWGEHLLIMASRKDLITEDSSASPPTHRLCTKLENM